MMAKRFGRSTDHTWKKMTIRKEVLSKNFKKRSGRVMFPSSHDIFNIQPFKEACFIVLRKLLECENEVLITTKPQLTIVQEIIDEFGDCRHQFQFRFTITSNDDRLLRFWESNASGFEERLASLKYAFRKGSKTSVSIEPFLDYDPTELIKTVAPFITESIWLGRMNYIRRKGLSEKERPYYNEIRRNYETRHLWEICKKLNGHPKVRIKDSIRNQLARAR